MSDTKEPAAPAPPPPAHAGWTASDLLAGSALVVLLIALFLPWYGETLGIPVWPGAGAVPFGRLDGPTSHWFLWIVLALAMAGIALIAGRQASRRMPGIPLAPRRLLIGATGIAFLLCLLGVIVPPPRHPIPFVSYGIPLGLADPGTVFVGWSYGGFIAVVAAGLAVAAAVWTARRPHRASSPRR